MTLNEARVEVRRLLSEAISAETGGETIDQPTQRDWIAVLTVLASMDPVLVGTLGYTK